jgi:PAS domain S-box-containing protein
MNDTKIRVLFVDDEEANLKAFKTTFRRDMNVFLANSGPEALAILDKEEVHVIISDQRMPGMTGSEFLTIAKERYPKSIRMLLTGFADMEAVVAAVNRGGIYSYATKPWDSNDLSLRIQQAFEIHQLREEKEKLLRRYQQIFDTSGDPIVIVDHRGAVLEANSACGRLMEMTMEELGRCNFTDHIEAPERLVRSLREKRTGNEFVNVDLTVKTAKGNMLDCLMTATYLGKRTHGRDAFQAVIKDITDRKQEEKRIRKLNTDLDKRVAARTGQLLEALEDLGSFSYTVAHDLRSPLKNIAALSEHLHEHATKKGSDSEEVAFSERINKSAQRLLGLVDDLLNFSQTNTRELERNEVPLLPLVEQVVNEQVAESRMDEIVLSIEPEQVVLADAPMLKVVLHNLLSNALKFTREKESPVIEIGYRREGDRDILFVKDNGVGFDAQHKEQAFGAFKRLHKADQFEGTGVGLAIVHRIVSKHGGEVWAESEVGHGTTILFALPIALDRTDHIPFIKVA